MRRRNILKHADYRESYRWNGWIRNTQRRLWHRACEYASGKAAMYDQKLLEGHKRCVLIGDTVLLGVLIGVAQIGVLIGPLIGGALTQFTSWRWCKSGVERAFELI